MKFLPVRLILFALLGVLFVLPGAQGAVTLLDDTFIEASRSGPPNLPSSTPWYTSNSSSDLVLAGTPQALVLTPRSNFLIGYFTPQALSVGDSITLSFTFTVEGNANGAKDGIRLGLFDSGGSRIASDGKGLSSDTYINYTGYGVQFDPGADPTNLISTLKRSSGKPELMTNGALSVFGLNRPVSPQLTAGVPYTGVLTLTRTAAGSMTASFSLNGVTISNTDSVSTFNTFDTIVIHAQSGVVSSLSFSEIKVVYDAIPEPSTVSLLGLSAGIGLLIHRSPRFRWERSDAFSSIKHSGGTQAFTLIELMVAIGIAVVMVALLLPTLQKAQATSDNVGCLANLRQIGVGIQNYVADHEGSLPGPLYAGIYPVPYTTCLTTFLAPYMGYPGRGNGVYPPPQAYAAMLCPAYKRVVPASKWTQGFAYQVVYALRYANGNNDYVKGPSGILISPWGHPDGKVNLAPLRIATLGSLVKAGETWAIEDADVTSYSATPPAGVATQPVHGNHWNKLYFDGRVASSSVAVANP